MQLLLSSTNKTPKIKKKRRRQEVFKYYFVILKLGPLHWHSPQKSTEQCSADEGDIDITETHDEMDVKDQKKKKLVPRRGRKKGSN